MPLPVSVNVSRRDLQQSNIVTVLTALMKKYRIPYELLRLEVTESAFAQSGIIEVVDTLINLGFTVEIDDFGSAYSSLNTLKDVPASILKLDMKFFENTRNSQRSGNIVESVVRMAKWLGMAVIAEGVEDEAQADYLKSIGCYYIQGYYYAKPMPMADYENLLCVCEKEPKLTRLKTLETLDNSEFWNPKSMDTLIFNSYVGGACIFEYYNGKTELFRANDQYTHEFGLLVTENAQGVNFDLPKFLAPEEKEKLNATIRKAIDTHRETDCEIRAAGRDHVEFVHITIRLIAYTGDRFLFYSVVRNMTQQRLAQEDAKTASEMLRAIVDHSGDDDTAKALQENVPDFLFAKALLDNLPCGAALYEYDRGEFSAIHINRRYWELVGRQPTDYRKASPVGMVHPDDIERIKQKIKEAIMHRRNFEEDFRIRCSNEDYRSFHVNANVAEEANGKYLLYTSYIPISEQQLSMQQMMPYIFPAIMKSSADLTFAKDKNFRYLCCSHSYARNLGLENENAVVGKTDFELFSKSVASHIRADDVQLMADGVPIIDKMMISPTKTGLPTYSRLSKYLLRDSQGNALGIYGVGRDITERQETRDQLKLLTETIPGGLATFACSERECRLEYYNDGFCKLFGYTRAEFDLSVDALMDHIHREDRAMVDAQMAALVKYDTSINCIYRIRTKDETLKWVSHKANVAQRINDSVIVNAVFLDVTEQETEKERLRVSEELNRIAIEHSGNIITRFDVQKRTLTLPGAFNTIFQLPHILENVPQGEIALGRVSEDTAGSYTELFESIIRGEATGSATYKQNSTKGWRWLEAQFTTVFSSTREPVSAVISFTDITEKLEKEVVFNKWQQSLKERPEDSYTLLRCNLSKGAAFDSTTGSLLKVAADSEKVTFDRWAEVYANRRVHGDDRAHFLRFINSDIMLAEYYRGHRSDSLEYREQNPDGSVRWLRLSVDLVEYPNSKDVEGYLMFEDIDKQKKAELLTRERSETDPLTGILNRATFISRLEQTLHTSEPGEKHALFMLDIDNFKQVNDTLGHGEGDKVLRELTMRIGSILRHSDLIGRLGGDEFFVFLKDIPNAKTAAAKAKLICEHAISTGNVDLPVTVSIGIAMIPKDGNDFDTLYRKVDAALYQAKHQGKDAYLFVSEQK